jgi:drug/metabolite transporter (DMT)-like permease
MGEIYALIALCLFASNMVLTKVASGRVDINIGFTLATGMNVAFSLLLFGLQTALRTDALHWRWDGFLVFALAGIFTTYLGRFFFFTAVVRFGPARASVFQVTGPIFTVLIAWAALGERMSAMDYAGIAITLGGLCLIVYVPGAATSRAAAGAEHRGVLGRLAASILFVGLGASLCYATGNVLRGVAMARWDEPILGSVIAAGSALLMILLTRRQAWRIARDVKASDRKGVLMYLGGGVLTICAQIMVFFSIRHTAVSIATLISSCAPVIVIPMSYWLLGNTDKINGRIIVGALLAMTGVALVLIG